MEVAGFKMNYRSFIALSQLSEADQAAIRASPGGTSPISPRASGPREWSDDPTSLSRST